MLWIILDFQPLLTIQSDGLNRNCKLIEVQSKWLKERNRETGEVEQSVSSLEEKADTEMTLMSL